MTQQSSTLRQFFVAFLAAVWIHVGLFLLFVVLLIFEVISAHEIAEDQKKEEVEDFSELVLSFEPDEGNPVLPPEPEAEKEEPAPSPEDGLKFAQTREDQAATESPKDASFIGERDTAASSDAGAEAGDKKMAALSGDKKLKSDPKTFDSTFSDGEQDGPGDGEMAASGKDAGKDALSNQSEDLSEEKERTEKLMTQGQDLVAEKKAEEFVETKGVTDTIEDEMAKEEKKAVAEVQEVKPEVKVVPKKRSANRSGGFNSQTSKTKVRGVLSARGMGSLDVRNTAVGSFGSNIFKSIEREWQIRNYRYRSLIAPGSITLYFVVDKKGKVSRQRQIEMRGASSTQMGIVLNAVNAAKIPAMSKAVIQELNGEDLELTMSFSYN